MEESEDYFNGRENGSSSQGQGLARPPNPLAAACRPSPPCNKSLLRHPSLIKTKTSGVSVEPGPDLEDRESEFIPIVRSGACTDIGLRPKMEDVYICVDDFTQNYGLKNMTDGPSAFYGI